MVRVCEDKGKGMLMLETEAPVSAISSYCSPLMVQVTIGSAVGGTSRPAPDSRPHQ